ARRHRQPLGGDPPHDQRRLPGPVVPHAAVRRPAAALALRYPLPASPTALPLPGRTLMKITRLTTAVVQANYDYTFVRIETDQSDLDGTGECFFAPGLTAILAELAPLLIGRDPREIQRLVQHLARKTSGAGSTSGIVWNAITGIEAALLDLVG